MSALERPVPRAPSPPLVVVPFAREPWEELLDYLRRKLGQAERGELRALMIVVEYDNGDTGFRAFHGENTSPAKMLGEIELLKHAIVHRESERRDERA